LPAAPAGSRANAGLNLAARSGVSGVVDLGHIRIAGRLAAPNTGLHSQEEAFAMFGRHSARWPRTFASQSPRIRVMLGAVVATAVLGGTLGIVHAAQPPDSGLVACGLLSDRHSAAEPYSPRVRADFMHSRWPDLRTAGTAYTDIAQALHASPSAYGGETVWFYERLATACSRHHAPGW